MDRYVRACRSGTMLGRRIITTSATRSRCFSAAASVAYRISKRWSVTARGQQFSANPEDFDGTMAEYHGDIQYRLRRNFTLGLGYTDMKTNLQVFDADQPVLFDLNTTGPELFFRVSF